MYRQISNLKQKITVTQFTGVTLATTPVWLLSFFCRLPMRKMTSIYMAVPPYTNCTALPNLYDNVS